MRSISSLKCPDRLEIFRHLAVDDSGRINPEILSRVTGKDYEEFEVFCDRVFSEREKIQEISCILSADTLQFGVEYK